jgi:cytosolic carboxypeptidase protein 5
MRVFNTHSYKPVWKALPDSNEWNRIETETIYEQTYTIYYKYSWTFEVILSDNEYFFAYAPAYPYEDISRTVQHYVSRCPDDSKCFKEVLTTSIDGRSVEIVTLSNKNNFCDTKEAMLPDLFPFSTGRCEASKKPVIFITARVHPGETPSSFVMEGILNLVFSNDLRAAALRNNFVFKIVPVLNPDGVFRGNFRVDQNGVNLNRCYIDPDKHTHPSIYAVKKYFEYLGPQIKYYFDLHAHASKKSCFLFGNSLEYNKQIENQALAKLIEINSSYFKYSECDFSEKSMSSKDPNHSKEGSARVALHKATGIIHSYTIECSYYMPRPLHSISLAILVRSGKIYPEMVSCDNLFYEVSYGIMCSILDLEKLNPASRIQLSDFRFLESLKEWIKVRVLAYNRLISKKNSKIL